MAQIHIKLIGRVQGVGCRAFIRRAADAAHVSGWVRNRRDGSVEVLAEGPQKALDVFLNVCRAGPACARVDEIKPVSVPDAPLPPFEPGVFVLAPTV